MTKTTFGRIKPEIAGVYCSGFMAITVHVRNTWFPGTGKRRQWQKTSDRQFTL